MDEHHAATHCRGRNWHPHLLPSRRYECRAVLSGGQAIALHSVSKSNALQQQQHASGHAGKPLDIQAGSNLVNWTSLVLKTNTTGTASITDSEPGQARRFYRAVQLP